MTATFRSQTWAACVLLTTTLLLAGAGCGKRVAAPSPPGAPITVAPGASWRRDIQGGEIQAFHFRLRKDAFLAFEVQQRVVRLSGRILDDAGKVVAAAEGGGGPDSSRLLLRCRGKSPYRLEIRAQGAPPIRGGFELAVRELRPEAARDADRVRAARALAEGRRLLAKDLPAKARESLQEALRRWRAAGDSRGEGETLMSLGDLELGRQSYREALAPYGKALASFHRSGWWTGQAAVLSNVGLCDVQLGLFDDAIHAYRKSLEIWRDHGGAYEQAVALEALGYGYLSQGDPKTALPLLQEALPLAEAAGDLKGRARITNAVGSAQYSSGYPSEALDTLQKALALGRALGDQALERDIEGNLGTLYYKKGQLQKAVDVFTQLIAESRPDQRGWLYLYLGAVYLDLGEPEKSLGEYGLALHTFRRAGDRVNEVNALIGVGAAYQRQQDPRAALPFFAQASRILPRPTWDTLHYFGLALDKAGQPADALPLLERALEIARESHTPEREAQTLVALGSVDRDLGKADLAAARLSHAISLAKRIDSPAIEAQGFLQRAILRKGRGSLSAARMDAEEALQIIESTRQSIAGQQIRTSFFANRRGAYDFYINLLLELDRVRPRDSYGAQALWASERSRGRGLLDLLTEGRINVAEEMPPDLRRREGEISDGLARVQSSLRVGNLPRQKADGLRAELERLDQRRQELDWEIRARNPRYAQIRYPAPLKLAEIQRRVVDPDTALLEFALGEAGSTLFVVTREGMGSYRLPPSQLIADLVRRLRPALEQESFRSKADYLEIAHRLYQILLAPASRMLRSKADLVIVPDGALYYVPFEVLLTEPAGARGYRDLPYLLRRFSIAYVPSASVLAELRESRPTAPPAGREQVAAFAPFAHAAGASSGRGALRRVSRDPAGHLYPPLPSSAREVSSIAALYPARSLSFFDQHATETELKTNPAVAASRRLHLATHAETDEIHPESSALVLKADARSDGMLRVDEIFNLKLAADLAVLSACRTALGKEVTGEGLVGLTRAFFYAGVPSLVVSLWNVADGPTPDLMVDFYRDLDRLHWKARALREAKLAMIDRDTYSHPSYWAPFILLGEPR